MFGIVDVFGPENLLPPLRTEESLEELESRLRIEGWLKHPTAFWLHPEGPLSDTTPEQWLAKQKMKYTVAWATGATTAPS